MELLLSKSQKSGMMGMGAIVFVLNIKTKLTAEEQSLVRKYKMGKEVVYEKMPVTGTVAGMGSLAGALTAITAKALRLIFTVDDLVKGRTIECKDILDMIAAEEQIRNAADGLWGILQASKNFEGEEVVSYPRDGLTSSVGVEVHKDASISSPVEEKDPLQSGGF